MKHGKKESEETKANYKIIWIHGIAAAFGGDFIVVLLLTIALSLIVNIHITFLIGLLFGIGSWLSQSLIVALVYKGVIKVIKKDFSIMIRAGRFSLLFLGIFMILLGIFSLMSSTQ
ncbi:hypothetical protein [Saccharolobus caldissimus]|uniref:Uncharacterized protein n=1 Tax=Saccharolobus caldissimus TaxID=1702097 RepID=A0AAQ4CPZ3_9CREN|nr:hypothetical protein [Saccharolobus caldissimus]BDB97874.1 hypothetical protein SACC_08910 [Saccharolobus caldissimus]